MEQRLLHALACLESALGILCLLLVSRFGTSYGRYWSPGSAWPVPARPGWVLQELPSLAVPLLVCAHAPAERLARWPNGVLLAMFLVHYAHRSLIFPFLIRGGKPMPIYSWTLAFLFCAFNGYLQSRYLSQYAVYDEDWVTDPRFLTGFILWLTGMLINIHSDHILRNLRKPGETGYKIPRGGLFEYITAANYFGEIIEWCGFALASWSIQGLAFALFTFCFLFSRAKQHHQLEGDLRGSCRVTAGWRSPRRWFSEAATTADCPLRVTLGPRRDPGTEVLLKTRLLDETGTQTLFLTDNRKPRQDASSVLRESLVGETACRWDLEP